MRLPKGPDDLDRAKTWRAPRHGVRMLLVKRPHRYTEFDERIRGVS